MIKISQLSAWLIATLIINAFSFEMNFIRFIIPLCLVTSLFWFLLKFRLKYIEYFLFFSISIASLLGLTQTLTGSHAKSTNEFLFGLSFYTTSIAYLIAINRFNFSKILSISNPLLLSTGPIALFFICISHKSFKDRFKYYFPFIIIGIFMFQIVASPLTEFFFLLNKTDLVSTITFSIIFEIFVYMNFCGLSLIIYGLFGIIGYRIPLNFKQPFSSKNIVEFWRGWHISLSMVLKVLFYKPLRARFSLFVALMGVYFASAMWHGITFNFLIWGLFHTLSFWITIKLIKHQNKFLPIMLMPVIIIIGRLIFADSNIDRLFEKLSFRFESMDGFYSLFTGLNHSLLSLIFGILLISAEFIFKDTKVMNKRNYKYLRTPFALFILCIFGVLTASNVGMGYAVYGQR